MNQTSYWPRAFTAAPPLRPSRLVPVARRDVRWFYIVAALTLDGQSEHLLGPKWCGVGTHKLVCLQQDFARHIQVVDHCLTGTARILPFDRRQNPPVILESDASSFASQEGSSVGEPAALDEE